MPKFDLSSSSSPRQGRRVKGNIFISGSIARDIIMDFPGRFREHIDPRKIHVLSLSFAVENLKENYGGTAANICYNLALLGERPEIIGFLGTDGLPIKTYLQKQGISTYHLAVSKHRATATAYIITDRDDNQIAGFHAGAMMEGVKLPQVQKGDWAIIAAENPRNMIRLAKYYTARGVNYIFDPGQQITALSKSDLATGIRGARVLIGNDYEIGVISSRLSLRGKKRRSNLIVNDQRLLRFACNDLIIIRTFGAKGSEILSAGRKIRVGIAKPRRVVDPTGAGDAYRAGLLKGLILGYDLKRCGQMGATAASFAVEEYGTQNHRTTQHKITNRFKIHFG